MSSFMWSTHEMNASRSSLGKSGSRTRCTMTPWRSSSPKASVARRLRGEHVDLEALRDELLGQLAHVARQPALHDRRVLPGEDQDARRHDRRRTISLRPPCRCRSCSTVTQVTMTPSRSCSRRGTTRSTCAPSPPWPATARSSSRPSTPAGWPRWPASRCRSPRARRARAPASWSPRPTSTVRPAWTATISPRRRRSTSAARWS